MKRCPYCSRTYTDESFNFCLEDGHRLSTSSRDELTLFLPTRRGNFDSTLQDQPLPDGPTKTKEQIRFEYWSALTSRLSDAGGPVKFGPARSGLAISATFAHPKVRVFTNISLSKKIICSGIRTLNQKELYKYLSNKRSEIERGIDLTVRHPALDFRWRAEKKFQSIGEFSVCFPVPAIEDFNSREKYLVWHQRILEALYQNFYKRVRTFDPSRSLIPRGLRSAPDATRLVSRFWKGFESSIRVNKDLTLNKPSLSNSPVGKSSMSKTYQGFRFAVQIHPAKDSADVNVTVGQAQYLPFAKLHKSRNGIHKQLRKSLQWKLNDSGESWALVSRDFRLSEIDKWDSTYEWLIKNLRLFLKVFLPRIHAIRSRIEKQKTMT